MPKDISDYNLTVLPPEGHKDLGQFIWNLFEDSYTEKERLGLMDRWRSNYQLFRGNHWGEQSRDPDKVTANLNFANIERTVANITAENPVAEVVDLSLGSDDKVDQVLTQKMKKWWNETEQQTTLGTTSLNNEIYGITIEKAAWNKKEQTSVQMIVDAYSYFPAPGYFAKITDMPYQIHAYPIAVSEIERQFNVKDVAADDVRTILGIEDREDVRPNATMIESGVGVGIVKQQATGTTYTGEGYRSDLALVVECWIKDRSTHSVVVKDEKGEPVFDEEGKKVTVTEKKYKDDIRVVTVINNNIVLSDMDNPNINWGLPIDQNKNTHAWGRIPFYKVNSYDDTTSIWGFSAAEQTGPLNKKIDELVSRMLRYANQALDPILILEQGCGITKSMIKNKINLVLMPARPNARIEYLSAPELPASFFEILNTLISLHD
ncbi:hypothetical protein KAR91_12440, partial [Candidatus Pacearchaeota archaeon]|nr:hypothetical protein [Candidatus Pacearchaeota archaeon]